MLGFLIVLILSFSLITAILQGSLDSVCSALLASPQKAVELAVATGCGICLWSGVMEVARQAGLLKTLSKLFSPVVSRLFPRIKKDSAAAQEVCVNLAANLLGLGAAAAPCRNRQCRSFRSAPTGRLPATRAFWSSCSTLRCSCPDHTRPCCACRPARLNRWRFFPRSGSRRRCR